MVNIWPVPHSGLGLSSVSPFLRPVRAATPSRAAPRPSLAAPGVARPYATSAHGSPCTWTTPHNRRALLPTRRAQRLGGCTHTRARARSVGRASRGSRYTIPAAESLYGLTHPSATSTAEALPLRSPPRARALHHRRPQGAHSRASRGRAARGLIRAHPCSRRGRCDRRSRAGGRRRTTAGRW